MKTFEIRGPTNESKTNLFGISIHKQERTDKTFAVFSVRKDDQEGFLALNSNWILLLRNDGQFGIASRNGGQGLFYQPSQVFIIKGGRRSERKARKGSFRPRFIRRSKAEFLRAPCVCPTVRLSIVDLLARSIREDKVMERNAIVLEIGQPG